MRAHLVIASILLSACQGQREPPLETGFGLTIATPDDRRMLSIDENVIVATRETCGDGEVLEREGAAWVCASLSTKIAEDPGLRNRLDRIAPPSSFTTARGCAVLSDPGANLEWRNDCPQHRGTSVDPITLRCPVTSHEAPTWNQLVLWVDDAETSTPDASSVDVALLAIDNAGVFDGRGLQRVAGTELRAREMSGPQRVSFTALSGVQALELEVVLRTDPAAIRQGFRPARFCGFGLTNL